MGAGTRDKVSKVLDANFALHGVKLHVAAQIASAPLFGIAARRSLRDYQRLMQDGVWQQAGLAYLFNFDRNVVLCEEHFESLGFGFGAYANARYCPVFIYILVR
jgi:hypothetical protein